MYLLSRGNVSCYHHNSIHTLWCIMFYSYTQWQDMFSPSDGSFSLWLIREVDGMRPDNDRCDIHVFSCLSLYASPPPPNLLPSPSPTTLSDWPTRPSTFSGRGSHASSSLSHSSPHGRVHRSASWYNTQPTSSNILLNQGRLQVYG